MNVVHVKVDLRGLCICPISIISLLYLQYRVFFFLSEWLWKHNLIHISSPSTTMVPCRGWLSHWSKEKAPGIFCLLNPNHYLAISFYLHRVPSRYLNFFICKLKIFNVFKIFLSKSVIPWMKINSDILWQTLDQGFHFWVHRLEVLIGFELFEVLIIGRGDRESLRFWTLDKLGHSTFFIQLFPELVNWSSTSFGKVLSFFIHKLFLASFAYVALKSR